MLWIPSVEVESNQGTREVNLLTRHFMDRKIFLTGPIDADVANNFVSQLLYLAEDDDPITIYINSPGGEVNAGLLIYDAIQGCDLPLNMICTGLAASMAAIILAGGQLGRRSILPHSRMMIHEPLISDGVGGSATSIKNISDSILSTRDILNGILAKHTGKSRRQIAQATSFDNTMNAEDAVSFGLVDRIATSIWG